MKQIGEMIKALLERNQLKQKDLAQQLGVQSSAVSQWVRGKTKVDPKNLPGLAKFLGVTVDDLLYGRIPGEDSEAERVIETSGNAGRVQADIRELYTQIPFLSAKAQAGIPTVMIETCQLNWIEESYPVYLPEGVSKLNKLNIEVIGESMEPELRNGDIVLAQTVQREMIKYKSGGVFAVLYAGGFVIKRIKTNELSKTGTLTLWSDNEKYGTIMVTADEIQCVFEVLQFVYRPVR